MAATLDNMDSMCLKLKSDLEDINRTLLSMPTGSELLNDLNKILKIEEDIPVTRVQTALQNNSPKTPSSVVRCKPSFDFDACPHTPTLEQLGISDNALAIVGEGRAKSRLGQISDTDSEYKISPSGSMTFSLGHSIPSIFCVQNGHY